MFTNEEYKKLGRTEKINRLKEIFLVFLKLGIFSFGGPAAHIALMDEEVVKKREWLTREKFMDLLGATNLIPGPNSTELAIHLGFERGGVLGLLIAGIAFIVPAMAIVLAFAVLYVRFGSLPEVSGILYGVKPVIMAIIIQALYRLGRSVVKNKLTAFVGAAVLVLSFAGITEIPLLFAAAAVTTLIVNRKKIKNRFFSVSVFPAALIAAKISALTAAIAGMPPVTIFLTFLKIGSVLYGSGYVLLAFLEAEFVTRFAVITNQQLIDAVAVGQFTPGPVFTTATFIGYLIGGFKGALLATLGIFLPAFVLVLLVNPLIPKLRKSSWMSGALDGVNVASLGLMAVVSVKLGAASLLDPFTAILFLSALGAMMKFKFNSVWAILIGGVAGYIYRLLIL